MSFFRSIFSLIFYCLNTLFWFVPIFIFGLIKLIPFKPLQTLFGVLAKSCASNWVATNSLIQNIFSPYKIELTGLDALQRKDWYLVIANHQSWVDILVLQRVLHNRIPFLNFFLKKELLLKSPD